jgi:UDP-glucose 4-epimerase
MSLMTIMVIGGGGFIGSHVVDFLLAEGHSVVLFDRHENRWRKQNDFVQCFTGDFSDKFLIAEALSGVSHVIHLASSAIPATSNLSPANDIIENLVSTVQLLELMRSLGIRKMVYMSSGGTVYGIPDTDPVAETHPLRPISSYGIVKVAVENYLAMERALYGLEYVVLRPSNPYGPRQGHRGVQGLIGTYLWRTIRGEPLQIWGDGSVCRDYIHVSDVARLCVRTLGSGASGCYNAGSGVGRSVQEIADIVRSVTGVDTGIEYLPGRAFDVPRVVLDCEAAAEQFGWRPEIEISEGIQETWAWVREHA